MECMECGQEELYQLGQDGDILPEPVLSFILYQCFSVFLGGNRYEFDKNVHIPSRLIVNEAFQEVYCIIDKYPIIKGEVV